MLYREIIAVCSEIHTQTMWAERRFCNIEPNIVHKWTTKGSCKMSTSRLFRSKAAVPPMQLSAFDWRMWHIFVFLATIKMRSFLCLRLKSRQQKRFVLPLQNYLVQGQGAWVGGGGFWPCFVMLSSAVYLPGVSKKLRTWFDFGNWFCLVVNQIDEALKLVTSRIGFKLLYRFV